MGECDRPRHPTARSHRTSLGSRRSPPSMCCPWSTGRANQATSIIIIMADSKNRGEEKTDDYPATHEMLCKAKNHTNPATPCQGAQYVHAKLDLCVGGVYVVCVVKVGGATKAGWPLTKKQDASWPQNFWQPCIYPTAISHTPASIHTPTTPRTQAPRTPFSSALPLPLLLHTIRSCAHTILNPHSSPTHSQAHRHLINLRHHEH